LPTLVSSRIKNNLAVWATRPGYYYLENGAPFTFGPGYHYLYDIYADDSREKVIKKSTQCGVSAYGIARSFHAAEYGRRVIFLQPADGQLGDFVKDRVDSVINYSSHLIRLLRAKTRADADRTGLKRIGRGLIYFRGTGSVNNVISVPADLLIGDEIDFCNITNIELAKERLEASDYQGNERMSTPTIPGYGIDKLYAASDKKRYMIKCGGCGEYVAPDFYKHVVEQIAEGRYELLDRQYKPGCGRDVNLYCPKCGGVLDRTKPGEWVAESPSVEISGYHITKLIASRKPLAAIVKEFIDAVGDEQAITQFDNCTLGIARMAEGACLTDAILDGCLGTEVITMPRDGVDGGPCVAGIDQSSGRNKHYVVIDRLLDDGRRLRRYIGRATWGELEGLLVRYKVTAAVCDIAPETTKAKELQSALGDRDGAIAMYLADYNAGDLGADWYRVKDDDEHVIVKVDRTQSLDKAASCYTRRPAAVILPANASAIARKSGEAYGTFYKQMGNSVRVYRKNPRTGEFRAVWQDTGPDHYRHADNYANMAAELVGTVHGPYTDGIVEYAGASVAIDPEEADEWASAAVY
jgi:hypothetical protein